MIKLVSVNIERSKHLDLVIPFLQKEQADVVCLQELMEYDIPQLTETLGAHCRFSVSAKHLAEGKTGRMGVGILTAMPLLGRDEQYYWGDPEGLPVFDPTSADTKRATECRALLSVEVEENGRMFHIATTHFTWTPNGEPDEYQREDMKRLLRLLADKEEFVLCGDFNSPRGGEIFSTLAEKYKDNIPREFRTSIDADLHRAGDLQLMVDGLFTTPGYEVSDVRLEFGVSDHAAVVANIENIESA